MNLYVHSSIIYCGQDMKTIKVSFIANWIKKMRYIYTMEYYSAIRKDEIVPFVTTWMDLENLMLSEMSVQKS